ncbi:HPr-rel-A system PqqD family peptide chaperone [Sphingobium mellinum]|uniref:HPr-rel-A system PqqD family peptide chaperone n=1 Tax=Sphingobium mellinum TaxID=1387166 RepID=UPI0030EE3B11
MEAERRYGPYGSGAIIPCVLEDITLLYHRASGQTHMVISPVPEILQALRDGTSMSAAEVHARLARDYDLGPEAEAIAQIEAHLQELASLGLVPAQ